MKRYTVITAALAALTVGAVGAPTAGASSRAPRAHHAVRHARTFSFYATVVRANSSGLVVRTAKGQTLHFSAAQIGRRRNPLAGPSHHRRIHRRRHALHGALDTSISAGSVVINILGLQPGATVLITETVAPDGTVTITITLPAESGTVSQSAAGVVTDVENDAFEITTADGVDLRLQMAPDQLSNLNLETCDTVAVTYHQDAGLLIADGAQVTGANTSGDCAPTYDSTGAIAQVSGSSITIDADQGPMTFSASDPSITDGFQNGDVVDVTYTENSDGTMDAVDVEYVEQDATGTVTAVSASSLTLTDSNTGQPDVFIADPNNGLQLCAYAFDGVHVGDQVDVTYHQTAAGLVADSVDDQPPGS